MSQDATTPADDADLSAEVLAVSDGAYTLIVADFSDTDVAWEAYELLKAVEDGRHVEIESVVVVKRDADGTDRGSEGDRPQHPSRPRLGRRRGRRARRDLPAVDHRQRHRPGRRRRRGGQGS